MKILITDIDRTDTGLTGGAFADATMYVNGTKVSVTAGWEDHNNCWAPYGTSPDMWCSHAHELDHDELDALADAIRGLCADPADYEEN